MDRWDIDRFFVVFLDDFFFPSKGGVTDVDTELLKIASGNEVCRVGSVTKRPLV